MNSDDHFLWCIGSVEESDRGDNPPEIFTAGGAAGKDVWDVPSSGKVVA